MDLYRRNHPLKQRTQKMDIQHFCPGVLECDHCHSTECISSMDASKMEHLLNISSCASAGTNYKEDNNNANDMKTLGINHCSCDTLSKENKLTEFHPRLPASSSKSSKYLGRLFKLFAGKRGPRRRRSLSDTQWTTRMTSFLYTILILLITCLPNLPVSYACSSRSTPKPRPPSPTLRPNITIQTYTCPPEYDAHYCLNGATCFTVKIGESILYNCECAEGYMGQRCEFKDLDGSYLPSKQRAMLEQAGVSGVAAIVIILVVVVSGYIYVRRQTRRKSSRASREGEDQVDGFVFERRPFSQYYYNNPISISEQLQSNPEQSSRGRLQNVDLPFQLSPSAHSHPRQASLSPSTPVPLHSTSRPPDPSQRRH